MTKISIIVPVYNVERYIHRCLDSILRQTHGDFELILVDDGSPDNCGAICDEYAAKDKRIIVIHKTNGGLSSARNAGLDICTGKYILFCDSDDSVEPDWCECLVNAITEFPNSFVVCGFDRIGTDGTKQRRTFREQIIEECSYFELYKKGVSPYAWNKIYEKNKIDDLGLRFDVTIRYAEDVPFNVVYASNCDSCRFIPDRLNHYYQNEGSIMNRYNSDLLSLHLPLFSVRLPLIKESEMTEYCDIWFFHFSRLFDNIFDSRNIEMTLWQKLQYNQRIVNTDEFQFCLWHAGLQKENQHLIRFLKKKNYYLYWIYCTLSKRLYWIKSR